MQSISVRDLNRAYSILLVLHPEVEFWTKLIANDDHTNEIGRFGAFLRTLNRVYMDAIGKTVISHRSLIKRGWFSEILSLPACQNFPLRQV